MLRDDEERGAVKMRSRVTSFGVTRGIKSRSEDKEQRDRIVD